MPGLSVMLRDMIVHQPIHFSRQAKEDDLVFVYYDLSENISTHIVNGVGHMVGLNSPFDMGIVDSSVESSYIPIGKNGKDSSKIQAILLSNAIIEIKGILATQEYILTQLWVKFPGVSNLARMAGMSESKYKLAFKRVFNDTPNNFFLTEKLFLAKRLLTSGDYNSVLEIAYELEYSKINISPLYTEVNLESCLIFTNLVRRIRLYDDTLYKLPQQDLDSMDKSIAYMTNDLQMDFPGIHKLAEIAGMSTSKYKTLFKKIMKDTPQQFSSMKSLLMAKKLLNGGMFKSLKRSLWNLAIANPDILLQAYKKKFNLPPVKNLLKPTISLNYIQIRNVRLI
ncbi:hypothetical protein FQR65_LT14720 [Abscondita terminalis]|nr:hypothetical protein FQR65_LT14720 [Abscondita terminalis]